MDWIIFFFLCSRVELKRLCEIFTRMFADPHSKVWMHELQCTKTHKTADHRTLFISLTLFDFYLGFSYFVYPTILHCTGFCQNMDIYYLFNAHINFTSKSS